MGMLWEDAQAAGESIQRQGAVVRNQIDEFLLTQHDEVRLPINVDANGRPVTAEEREYLRGYSRGSRQLLREREISRLEAYAKAEAAERESMHQYLEDAKEMTNHLQKNNPLRGRGLALSSEDMLQITNNPRNQQIFLEGGAREIDNVSSQMFERVQTIVETTVDQSVEEVISNSRRNEFLKYSEKYNELFMTRDKLHRLMSSELR